MINHTDRPTATYPTADHLAHLEREEAAHRERLADLWADATPTEELPLIDAATTARTRPGTHACHAPAHPSTGPEQAAPPGQEAPAGKASSEQPRRQALRRHLRAALTGIALAAALLTSLQLYALDGINDAREAARAALSATPSPAPTPEQAPNARSGIQSAWVTQDTSAPYSKDDPTASPLDLPRCTTSPDTPMPCLAHVSADSHHVTVLEEDASLTGLDRR